MDLVDDGANAGSPLEDETKCIDAAISLISNIVETVCDHEHDLSMMRVINLLDLYRVYLQLASESDLELRTYMASISGPSSSVSTQSLCGTNLVSFERFIRDSRLLSMTAREATRLHGEKVLAPAPLSVSANDSVDTDPE